MTFRLWVLEKLDYSLLRKRLPESGLSSLLILVLSFYYRFGKMGVEWKDFSRKLQRTIQLRIKKIPGAMKKEKMPIVFILRNLLQGLSSLHFYDHSSMNKPEEAKEMIETIHQIIEIIHEKNFMQKKNGSKYIPFIFEYYFSLSSSISSPSSSFQWNVLDPKVSEYFFSLLMISYLSGKFSAQKYLTVFHR